MRRGGDGIQGFRSRCDALCRRPIHRQWSPISVESVVCCHLNVDVNHTLAMIEIGNTHALRWLGDGPLDQGTSLFAFVVFRIPETINGQYLAGFELRIA